MALYPFLLEPVYKEKVWGGRALERFGRVLPGGPETPIGESWELADIDATSPSGAGGEGVFSRIRNGPLQERFLRDVVKDFGGRVTGKLRLSRTWEFPLLLKYLDARANLSVQVHPSPGFVRAHPDAHLKSEAWDVVHAEPGAVICKGLEAGTTRDDLARAVERGSIEELLVRVPARPGECHYLPSGTVHALGAGVLVAEVQTPSDTTFRLFDWERTDRELHVEQALECADLGPLDASAWEPGTLLERDGASGRHLVSCEHFDLRHWSVPPDDSTAFESDAVEILMVVEGAGSVEWGEVGRTLPVRAGDTLFLPAALPAVRLRAATSLDTLHITIPEPDEDAP